MNYIKLVLFTGILLAFMIIGLKQQIDINEIKNQNDDLRQQNEQLSYEIDKLQSELDSPLDEEYIERVASDQLGYKDPNAQYFYNDLPD